MMDSVDPDQLLFEFKNHSPTAHPQPVGGAIDTLYPLDISTPALRKAPDGTLDPISIVPG